MIPYLKYKSAICLALLLATISINAQNWSQWRGPEANGVAQKGNYPEKISSQDDYLWKYELPGAGSSTPIIWEDKLIITSGIGEGDEAEDGVLCFDWDGKLLWETKLGKQSAGKHPRGSGSNSSAITDGKRIFVLFKSTTLAALDFDGNILWKTNIQEKYGELTFWWDFGTSPVLAEGNVIVAVLHEGDSYLLAFDQSTGKEAWKVARNYTCQPESAQSYTTPLVIKENGQSTILVLGADHLTGHSAKTGEKMWSYSGFNPDNKQYWRTIASPVVSEGIVVVPYGRGRMLAGLKLVKDGDRSEKDFLWSQKGMGSDVATPVIDKGLVYVLGFNGKLWCLKLKTGEELWQTKLPDVKGLFYSSPTLAGDILYLSSDEGSFYTCRVSNSGIDVLSHVHFEENFVASPVLLRDRLIIRGSKNLYVFGDGK